MIILRILVVILAFIASSHEECNRSESRRFDDLMYRMSYFGNTNNKFPETIGQLREWCGNHDKFSDEVEDMNKKCNKDRTKQAIGAFLHANRASVKNYCRPNSKVAPAFVNATRCYNANKQIELRIYGNLMDELIGAKQAESHTKIGHFCCSMKRATDRLRKGMEAKCEKQKVNTMMTFIGSISNNPMCAELATDPNKCTQLGLPPKKKKSERRAKCLTMQIVDLLNSANLDFNRPSSGH